MISKEMIEGMIELCSSELSVIIMEIMCEEKNLSYGELFRKTKARYKQKLFCDDFIKTIDKLEELGLLKVNKKQHQLVSDQKCYLLNDRLLVVPQDKGEPPDWAPVQMYDDVIWVDREIFDQLKARRYEKPCDICPDKIKAKCEVEIEKDEQKEE